MTIYKTLEKYCAEFHQETKHPHIHFIDFNKSPLVPRKKFQLSFYVIALKETYCGDLQYGNTSYDYAEGTMVFLGPNQIFGSHPIGELHQPYGKALVFHPDFIKGTRLGELIQHYTFFQYKSNEALHLSLNERKIVSSFFTNIETELSDAIDQHSKELILANVETLLKYCVRFYDRQFSSRSAMQSKLLNQFDELFHAYFTLDEIHRYGIPTVSYFAEKLHLSPNYFGDLIKKETGKTAQEHIQHRFIELAKEQLLVTSKNINEIADEMGFKHHQHFTRLFKQKVGVSPRDFRIKKIA
ncbi:MAG: helix-turn-helix domain-containing protein [Spirosomataceae bacterium]